MSFYFLLFGSGRKVLIAKRNNLIRTCFSWEEYKERKKYGQTEKKAVEGKGVKKREASPTYKNF